VSSVSKLHSSIVFARGYVRGRHHTAQHETCRTTCAVGHSGLSTTTAGMALFSTARGWSPPQPAQVLQSPRCSGYQTPGSRGYAVRLEGCARPLSGVRLVVRCIAGNLPTAPLAAGDSIAIGVVTLEVMCHLRALSGAQTRTHETRARTQPRAEQVTRIDVCGNVARTARLYLDVMVSRVLMVSCPTWMDMRWTALQPYGARLAQHRAESADLTQGAHQVSVRARVRARVRVRACSG
jgi:hypothetical protein